ncbi:hypothetical protein [Rhabdochlamydiaceae symbiont of Dictyostelium giganteum]|uniref:hypothetical protein n=1 Tax=Rhabdochlamydiaceae symbiont of Dictyostelium giganteum TaxID=3342349 RepID=UPI00384EA833
MRIINCLQFIRKSQSLLFSQVKNSSGKLFFCDRTTGKVNSLQSKHLGGNVSHKMDQMENSILKKTASLPSKIEPLSKQAEDIQALKDEKEALHLQTLEENACGLSGYEGAWDWNKKTDSPEEWVQELETITSQWKPLLTAEEMMTMYKIVESDGVDPALKKELQQKLDEDAKRTDERLYGDPKLDAYIEAHQGKIEDLRQFNINILAHRAELGKLDPETVERVYKALEEEEEALHLQTLEESATGLSGYEGAWDEESDSLEESVQELGTITSQQKSLLKVKEIIRMNEIIRSDGVDPALKKELQQKLDENSKRVDEIIYRDPKLDAYIEAHQGKFENFEGFNLGLLAQRARAGKLDPETSKRVFQALKDEHEASCQGTLEEITRLLSMDEGAWDEEPDSSSLKSPK